MAQHLRRNKIDIDQSAALTLGEQLTMSPSTETFADNAAANRLLSRRYRAGFEVPAVST